MPKGAGLYWEEADELSDNLPRLVGVGEVGQGGPNHLALARRLGSGEHRDGSSALDREVKDAEAPPGAPAGTAKDLQGDDAGVQGDWHRSPDSHWAGASKSRPGVGEPRGGGS
jgi:hypothetical protein